MGRAEAGKFLGPGRRLCCKLIAPGFVSEQKRRVVLAIGCTGGRHRSVALIEDLARRLRGEPAYVISVSHRDIEREG